MNHKTTLKPIIVKKPLLITLVILHSMFLSHVYGETIFVSNDAEKAIALDIAVSGDIIEVSSGVYKGNIEMVPGVIIKSESGPELTIIKGTGNGPVVSANNNEDNTAVLDGFTITNGFGDLTMGGGISIGNEADSNPKIINCIIRDNVSSGILIGSFSTHTSSTVIINNVISYNISPWGSAGIKIIHSSPKIINNTIMNNSTDINSLMFRYSPIFSFKNELLNDPGALTIIGIDSKPEITNNIIVNNSSLQGALWCEDGADPTLSTNNVWNNSGGSYYGCSSDAKSVDPEFYYDPLLLRNDYHLMDNSGCKDAGSTVSESFDIDGEPRDVQVDIGADEYVDSDEPEDGMPDYWEDKYGVYISTNDYDGDELTNIDEYKYFCNPTSSDTDGDNLPDNAELTTFLTSPINPDTDGDGTPDGEEDSDGDTINDGDEVNTYKTDPLKADTDDDDLPDWWEVKYSTATSPFDVDYATDTYDYDGDGLNNFWEYTYETNPMLADTDDDDMPDKWEVENKPATHPNRTDAKEYDYDGDGLTNSQEYTYGTNPNKKDTDYDTIPDKWEVKYSTATSAFDFDCSTDTYDYDGDGLNNFKEYTYGTNPMKADTDGDTINDGDEVNTYKTDPMKADTDGDGLPDGWEVNTSSTNPNKEESISIKCEPDSVECNESSTITVKIVNHTQGSLTINLSIVNVSSACYNLSVSSGSAGSKAFTSSFTGNFVGKFKILAEVIIDDVTVVQSEKTLEIYGFYDSSEKKSTSFKCIYDTHTSITIPAIFDKDLKVIINPQYILLEGCTEPINNPEFTMNISTAITGQGYEIEVSHPDDNEDLEHPFKITMHYYLNNNNKKEIIYHDKIPVDLNKCVISMYYYNGVKLLGIPCKNDDETDTITGKTSLSGYYVVQHEGSNYEKGEFKLDDNILGVRAIPNIFTPANNDGINDKVYFDIESTKEEITLIKITIYDLDGRKIREIEIEDDVIPSWDGKRKIESENTMEGGLYIYVAEFKGSKNANGIIVLAK